MNRLQGEAALVMDGSRGIGHAIAQRFAAEGVAVAVRALHADSAARAVAEIAERGGRAIEIEGNVADEKRRSLGRSRSGRRLRASRRHGQQRGRDRDRVWSSRRAPRPGTGSWR